MKYLFRILALPAIILLASLTFFKMILNFLIYGGEVIVNTKSTKKTVSDIFLYLKKQQELTK